MSNKGSGESTHLHRLALLNLCHNTKTSCAGSNGDLCASSGESAPTTTAKLVQPSVRCMNASTFEQRHEISNNVVCATSKASDQPAVWSEPLHRRRKLFNIFFFFLGGGEPCAANFKKGEGIAIGSYTHACTCTCMDTHVLNIHTPMHACTRMYACMHSLCKHTFYILI